ncbi:uncharacterized protein B4U79_04514, partial [Dinothrombium tinctorium]
APNENSELSVLELVKPGRVLPLGRNGRSNSKRQSPSEQSVDSEQTQSMAIASTSSDHHLPSTSNSLQQTRVSNVAATRPKRPEAAGRKKWSHEENAEIIALFYQINNCEDIERPGWRQKLFEAYSSKHPNHKFTEQNIADRKKVIFRNKLLKDSKIDEIKRQMGHDIFQSEHFEENDETRNQNYDDSTIIYDVDTPTENSEFEARAKRYESTTKRKSHNLKFQKDQKGFYRSLNKSKISNQREAPDIDKVENFWRNIWSNTIEHDKNAKWIKAEANNVKSKMNTAPITAYDVKEALKKSHNWKAPGVD